MSHDLQHSKEIRKKLNIIIIIKPNENKDSVFWTRVKNGPLTNTAQAFTPQRGEQNMAKNKEVWRVKFGPGVGTH
jgi:hypothetical protein